MTKFDKTIQRKTCPCSNPACGADLYKADYEDGKPVWVCCCCLQATPRIIRYRKSNDQRAHDLYRALKADWAETDNRLWELHAAGRITGGAVMVYGSMDNYHMNALLGLKGKLGNRGIKYAKAEAEKQLEQAKQFLERGSGNGWLGA